jgi:hypothetical protein
MAIVDISQLAVWDLSFKIEGVNFATKPPCWSDVIELGKVEELIKAQQKSPELEGSLRQAVKRFFPAEVHAALDKAGFDDLQAILAAASTYFGDYIKKKQQAAIAAVRPEPVAAAAPAKPSPPAK